ncbi:MAG: ribosome maturation factor RimM [Firmicutes bacterium]|jgi:16S rRNA processing protein RimM|nr:ribosome maturation factor RimM [Bacillota bacterium]MDH7494916.1 ribosome maturation factor RimM [Bacillota bacterium]
MTSEYIAVGQVTAPQGIRGEVRALPLTDFPNRFRPPLRLRVRKGEAIAVLDVEGSRQHRGFVVIKFRGVDSVDEAEKLRGAILEVPRAEVVPLEPGRYYFYEIEGLDVVTTEGRRLGRVARVLRGVANDVYEVEVLAPRSRRGRTILVPAVREIVKSIDLERGEMTIELIPGLE